jgi:hypothetical protein
MKSVIPAGRLRALFMQSAQKRPYAGMRDQHLRARPSLGGIIPS